LKKIDASSDKKNIGEEFLPAESLWRAAQMIRQNGLEVPPIDAEPTPLEMLGLTIGILRRRKHISRLQLAKKIGCSVEDILALEAGLLPIEYLKRYLPRVSREVGLRESPLQPLFRNIKFA
jgi:DNA-binding XRE family transcriptional regulator